MTNPNEEYLTEADICAGLTIAFVELVKIMDLDTALLFQNRVLSGQLLQGLQGSFSSHVNPKRVQIFLETLVLAIDTRNNPPDS